MMCTVVDKDGKRNKREKRARRLGNHLTYILRTEKTVKGLVSRRHDCRQRLLQLRGMIVGHTDEYHAKFARVRRQILFWQKKKGLIKLKK